MTVLVAAIHCGAKTLVTQNLKDFPRATLVFYDIQVQHPDAFLVALLNEESRPIINAIRGQRQQLRRPPRTVEEHLQVLQQHGLPRFVAALEPFKDQL